MSEDVIFYLKKIKNCLEEKGCVYLTAFVEKDFEKDYQENPPHKKFRAGPLHCLYNKDYFETLLINHGFRLLTLKNLILNSTQPLEMVKIYTF